MKLLDSLNDAQAAAVQHIDGPMLILAGAGSGKTKTITTRLAYLIDKVGIPPQHTLTLTFTNKAAQVMRTRALGLIKRELKHPPLLCTFHKFGLLFLRLHIERLEKRTDFTLIDSDDVKKIIKDIRNFLNDKENNTSAIIEYISTCKNHLRSPEDAYEHLKEEKKAGKDTEQLDKMVLYYQHYHNYLLKYNFIDFDDLLFLTYKILDQDKNFTKTQSEIYRYITVDEYQDTNDLQFALIKKLCTAHENICVVGDDDQSIYSWRGAKVENILNFQNEFQNVRLIKLEQNYRSVGTILNAANKLIACNKNRMGKNLICTRDPGEEIVLLSHQDEREEAQSITQKIKALLAQGVSPGEVAILYRINSLGLALEKHLLKEEIPYKILSGMRFYERAEIKDAIAYLRFLHNTEDDFSLERIINRPKRGLGTVSLNKIKNYAKTEGISLFEALCRLEQSQNFSKKTQKELEKFIEQVKILREIKELSSLVDALKNSFNFKAFYSEQDEGESKLANLDDFYASLRDEIKREGHTSLDEILSELSLLSNQDSMDGESIYLMSIHASKGLEFDYVFIVGLEEKFLPLCNETKELEEERRLAYVAFTRAKKGLCLSFSEERLRNGSREYGLEKSKFLFESGLLAKEGLKKGDLVRHEILGVGRVIGIEKEKIGINFGGMERVILTSFVKKIGE